MDNENTTTEKDNAPTQEPAKQQPPATAQDLAATMGSHSAKNEQADAAALQRERVNDGRLKKASEDLAAANARIAELEAKLAKGSVSEPAFDAAAVKKFAADPDDVDDTFAATTAGAMNALRDNVRKEMKGEFDALRAELNAAREAVTADRSKTHLEETLRAVEGAAPGLVVRIARGDLRDKWDSYLDQTDPFSGLPMRSILQGAVRDGRVDAAKEVYSRFVRDTGLSGQYGGAVMAPPRGAAPSAPRTAGNGQVWASREAIYAEMEKITAMKRRGSIDPKTYAARSGELEDALREGRYAR